MNMEQLRIESREGDRVRYVPRHAQGDVNHKDCEDGTISSFSDTFVRVKFDAQVATLGWDGTTAQGCHPEDLRVL